ncbi:MAG: hypothetical protein SCALA701_19360 [Candidatus Scalindua sp.]|nr:MAG: hypothetical protein SCALA701_19360 [Candidatus Scalindua sp.]
MGELNTLRWFMKFINKKGSFTECVGKNKEKHRFNCNKAHLKEYFLFPSPPPTSLLGEGGRLRRE